MNGDITDAIMRVRNVGEGAQKWWRADLYKHTTYITSFLVLLFVVYTLFFSAPSNFPVEDLVTISEGATLESTSISLADYGVIESPFMLRLLVTLMGNARKIHAGDYQFKKPVNVIIVAKRISNGDFGLAPVRIRIPEGSTIKDMSVIFSKKLHRFNKEEFLKKAKDLEGYLFPDTYFFLSTATEDIVIKAMLDNFESNILKINDKISKFGGSLNDVVIMASILEKEAKNVEDKRKIAGVLWKRIKLGMALQVDAPFVYFMGKNTFDLTLKDLQNDSPYNTYKHKGLPPGPIANPGLESILSAVTPKKHNFLFYLADKNGKTHFSSTYAEHLKNKRKYLGS